MSLNRHIFGNISPRFKTIPKAENGTETGEPDPIEEEYKRRADATQKLIELYYSDPKKYPKDFQNQFTLISGSNDPDYDERAIPSYVADEKDPTKSYFDIPGFGKLEVSNRKLKPLEVPEGFVEEYGEPFNVYQRGKYKVLVGDNRYTHDPDRMRWYSQDNVKGNTVVKEMAPSHINWMNQRFQDAWGEDYDTEDLDEFAKGGSSGGGDDDKAWKEQLRKSGSELLSAVNQPGMTYEDAFKLKDNYWTGDNPTVNSFLALGSPEPYRYEKVTLPTKSGGTKVLSIPMYDGSVWKATAKPVLPPAGRVQQAGRGFTSTLTKIPVVSYEDAYEGVDKDKYPTIESFIADAEFYKEHGRNMTPEEREAAKNEGVTEAVGIPRNEGPNFDPIPEAESEQDDDLPEGFNYWFVEGEKGYLDPDIYGYAKSDMPRQLSQPGINKAHLKRQMEEYAKTGEYPWGYKFAEGGQVMELTDDEIRDLRSKGAIIIES